MHTPALTALKSPRPLCALALAAALLAPALARAEPLGQQAPRDASTTTKLDLPPGEISEANLGVEPTLPAPAPLVGPGKQTPVWPTPLFWVATGIGLAGVTFVAGACAVQNSSIGEMKDAKPAIARRGCEESSTPCLAFVNASNSAETAYNVGQWVLVSSFGVAASLYLVSYISETEAPVKVEIAPTVGGAVVRGTF